MAIYKAHVLNTMDIVLLILIGVLSRLMPHPANMTAVGGIAVFSGAKLETKKALIITFVTMILSDAIVGFHSLMWATYGSLFIAVLIGRFVGKNNKVKRIISGTLFSSVTFYLVTNFAVWVATPLYPRTLIGFITCYMMALPFFRNSLIGDLFYAGVFFAGFGLLKNHIIRLNGILKASII